MNKHKLELTLALPSDAEACEACVGRMVAALGATQGITQVHVDRDDPDMPKLCLHYEPTSVRVEDIEALVERTGATLKARYEHLSAPAVGLRHERQARLVEGVFARQPGVLHASVAFGARRIYVEFDPTKTNRAAVLAVASKAGIVSYPEPESPAAAAAEHDEHAHDHGGPFGERSELVFSLACGALTGLGWGLQKAGVASTVTTGLFVFAYVLGAWFTVKEVVVALRARKFEIDFLMLLAAIGAAPSASGSRAPAAVSLHARSRARGLRDAPRPQRHRRAREARPGDRAARRRGRSRGGGAGGRLVVGDRILVKPNTRIPADGFVARGRAA
jgi:Cd2+/Zn2+-exporting ATPase